MYEWYRLFRINDNAMILRQSKHFRNFYFNLGKTAYRKCIEWKSLENDAKVLLAIFLVVVIKSQ